MAISIYTLWKIYLIIQVYDVAVDVVDMILAPNNWAYCFEGDDASCINLSNSNEIIKTKLNYYSIRHAKLHPSGNFIYGLRSANASCQIGALGT